MLWYLVLEVKIISNQQSLKKCICLLLKLWPMETKRELKQLFLKIKIFTVFSSVGKRFFLAIL